MASAHTTTSTPGASSARTAFLLARLGIGMSFFGHGLVRLPKLSTFATHMAVPFRHSILPESLVTLLAYILPFLEFGIGLLLLLGLFTKQALIAGAVIMILLIFGTTAIEQWQNLDSQFLHLAFFAGLLPFVDQYNIYALDKKLHPGH
ncbi:MAG TPA: DoxX family membrane protein [Puia sp.]|jgi:thiosulfate dehydrogenase [quinone] large subunit|nr:DoxX family membrane protein [Puia sp.]